MQAVFPNLDWQRRGSASPARFDSQLRRRRRKESGKLRHSESSIAFFIDAWYVSILLDLNHLN
jgi:hypothetical protein